MVDFKIEIPDLGTLSNNTVLQGLKPEQVIDLQRSLSIFGYPVGKIDGLIGRKTSSAWAEFKEDEYQGHPDLIGAGSVDLIQDKLNDISDRYSRYDFSGKSTTMQAIEAECIAQGLALKTQIAYVLATVFHETGHTWKPVKEAYWFSEAWRKQNLRYFPYYG